MTDIVERLRSARCIDVDTFVAHALHDAEAEIESLRSENAALREAARKVIENCGRCDGDGLAVVGIEDVIPCPNCADLRRLMEAA